MRRLLFTLFCPGLVLAGMAAAADWPQYRGPNQDAVSTEPGLRSWSPGGPRILWRAPIGEGYSQVAAVKGRLFTLDARGDEEQAVALEAATGKEIWRVRLDGKFVNDMGNGPRSTPTVDGDLVYVLSAGGKLAALRTANGQTVWQHDLRAEYGATPPNWGIATSPLVEGNLLVVHVGGSENRSVMAFDKANGKPVWGSQSDTAAYATPMAITVGGVRQIIMFTAGAIVSLAPQDGRLLWRAPWPTQWGVNVANPIFFPPDKLFVSSGYDFGGGLFQIRVAGGEVTAAEVWRSREIQNKFNSSVLHDGTIYGFHNNTLKALDAATGKERWKQSGFGYGSLIVAGDHLVVLGDRGKLALLEATPEEYRELGSLQVLEGRCWTPPSIADGKLYLRNQAEIVALDWTTPKAVETGK